jgi:hypothetical protein
VRIGRRAGLGDDEYLSRLRADVESEATPAVEPAALAVSAG